MSLNSENGNVTCTVKGALATVEFSHPAGNSCTLEMLQKMTLEVVQLGKHPEVRIIVLQSGGGKTFCAGANLKQVCSLKTAQEATEFFSGFAHLIMAMKNSPKLIIGRVQGKTVGGGVGIMAACDQVFATREASVRLSELHLGIAPLVIAPVIIHKIGVSAFSSLATDPTHWRDSNWGYQKGLIHKKYDSLTALEVDLHTYIETMSSTNLQAVSFLKENLWAGTEHWETLLFKNASKTATLALSAYTQKQLDTYRN